MTMSDAAFELQVAAGAASPCRSRSGIDICRMEARRILRILVPSLGNHPSEREYKGVIREISWSRKSGWAQGGATCLMPHDPGSDPAAFAATLCGHGRLR